MRPFEHWHFAHSHAHVPLLKNSLFLFLFMLIEYQATEAPYFKQHACNGNYNFWLSSTDQFNNNMNKCLHLWWRNATLWNSIFSLNPRESRDNFECVIFFRLTKRVWHNVSSFSLPFISVAACACHSVRSSQWFMVEMWRVIYECILHMGIYFGVRINLRISFHSACILFINIFFLHSEVVWPLPLNPWKRNKYRYTKTKTFGWTHNRKNATTKFMEDIFSCASSCLCYC